MIFKYLKGFYGRDLFSAAPVAQIRSKGFSYRKAVECQEKLPNKIVELWNPLAENEAVPHQQSSNRQWTVICQKCSIFGFPAWSRGGLDWMPYDPF